MIAIGTTLTYTAFDQESYSRGYGPSYENRTSRVSDFRYKVQLIPATYVTQDLGVKNIVSENKNPSIGETVEVEFMDGEEGRSYGWFLNRSAGKITEIQYRMENGDTIKTKDIKEVKAEPTKKE